MQDKTPNITEFFSPKNFLIILLLIQCAESATVLEYDTVGISQILREVGSLGAIKNRRPISANPTPPFIIDKGCRYVFRFLVVPQSMPVVAHKKPESKGKAIGRYQ